MTRVAGIDPGTVSFDVCVLEEGEPVFAASLPTRDLVREPASLVRTVTRAGPLDGAVGPSGYGLPLARLERLDESDLRLAFLSEKGGTEGIPRVVAAAASLREADFPVWIVPGVVHLPTVPEHRKVNRIDMGTADKLCAAAAGVVDQSRRLGLPPSGTDFLMLELGGAFTSALAVRDGSVVDGLGGSSGPPGARAPGCLDGEVAVLLGAVTKRHVFGGGAASVAAGRGSGAAASAAGDARGDRAPGRAGPADPAGWAREDGAPGRAWRCFVEGAEKACRSLQAVHPAPREILLSGRHAAVPAVLDRLADTLGSLAPVRRLEGPSDDVGSDDAGSDDVGAAALGAALLADGLAGGRHAGLVDGLGIREASGTVFDHLYLQGAARAAARWLGGRAP